MNGEIIEKENEWIGVEITDNNGYRHKIAVRFDGEIEGHGQDGYPDDSNERTDKGNEMVRQARDYAKWYVAQETGHDICPWYLDCDSIETVKAAVPYLAPEARVLIPSGSVAREAKPGMGSYAVSKAGAEALARGFATDLEQSVCVVDPGLVATELTGIEKARDPDDIAPMFLWAASEADPDEINGEIVDLKTWKQSTR